MGKNQTQQRERDKAIIDYLNQYSCARTTTLANLFFNSYSTAAIRLTKLFKYKAVNRFRDHITFEYIYYANSKPKQIEHRLILTDFHRELVKLGANILRFENELTLFEGLRPDGFIVCQHNKQNLVAFIECERQKPDIQKYEKFYLSEQWKIFKNCPKLIWITNKKVPSIIGMELIIIKEDLSNIREVFI